MKKKIRKPQTVFRKRVVPTIITKMAVEIDNYIETEKAKGESICLILDKLARGIR